MSRNNYSENETRNDSLKGRHPVLANVVVIAIVAVLGVLIVYLSLAVFTKHGEETKVPRVEKMSYTDAIAKLHEAGFKIEIRDSLYTDNVRPGYVIEQFPKANSTVKPGRKIFLYIQAVHPKEVVIDDDNNPRIDAFRGVSLRSALSRLEELGFKKVRVVRLLGSYDGVSKIIANGRVVKKMQRVPVNAQITVQVFDGRLRELSDSLMNIEFGTRRSIEEQLQEGYSSELAESYSSESYSTEPEIPEEAAEPAAATPTQEGNNAVFE